MSTPHDEWNSLSTFWLISCVLHALILMMPIKGMLPRMTTATTIELTDIGELTIAEATGTKQHASLHTEGRKLTPLPSQRKISATTLGREALRHDHSETSALSKPAYTSTKSTLLSKTTMSTTAEQEKPTHVASTGSKRPILTSAVLGTLPREGAVNESPVSVGTQTLISPARAPEGGSKGADVPPSIGVALEPTRSSESISGGQLNEGMTTTATKGRQTIVSQLKVSPKLLSLPKPSTSLGVGSVSSTEAQGGYSVVGLERAKGGGTATHSGESPVVTGGNIRAQPQVGGSELPTYAPSQSTRATNIAKGSPMLFDIIGSLSKPNTTMRKPTHLEPISAEPRIKGYTGLIIDARGLKVERGMSPRIYDERGRAIYGPQFVPANFAIEKGVVYYHTTLEGALKDKRAGPQPLIIKAIGVRGTARQDVIVTYSDGEVILRENAVGHFLERCNVIFIID